MKSKTAVAQKQPEAILLKDYSLPEFFITEVELTFDLEETSTRVAASFKVRRDPKKQKIPAPLVLDGEKLKLLSVRIDQKELNPSEYTVNEHSLTIHKVPAFFQLETEVEINPAENKALEGLYQSGNIFCTQNEPQGFRRITYFIDRPDVMSRYTTTIRADKKKYPVLLSNGNPMKRGDLEDGRHFVTWQDPFRKPCYLFALVAGDLGVTEDFFVTKSGKKVPLQIFVDKGNENRTAHAMESLKQAMRWDEDVFGLEYDLDLFMIVAVDAFNQGAMENKGLNIFNSHYILANPETATDSDFEGILGVVGHEYFHNWTGNRVTCRDWFQLTLKEGLTVFRDQEFSADMSSRAVKRLEDIRVLREFQFVEDGGPMAHPIQPQSYIEINNFYTTTVYEKGAAVIRMIQTLIGKENFRKGMDKYFEMYDGQAVTTEEFVSSMEKGSGYDLKQFRRWYHQAGTPVCKITATYDKNEKTYVLNVEQNCRPTPETAKKEPFYFPLAFGLLDSKGKEIPLQVNEKGQETTAILAISKPKETFILENIPEKPVPSFLRDFSATVKLEYNYSREELLFLLRHDTDFFNRYEAGQRLAMESLDQLVRAVRAGKSLSIDDAVLDAFGEVLMADSLDPAFRSEALVLPSLTAITEPMAICDYDSAFKAREFFLKSLARRHRASFLKYYQMFNRDTVYRTDPESIGNRTFKNLCLNYLTALGEKETITLAFKQFESAKNMTDSMAALGVLCHQDCVERKQAMQMFYDRWKKDTLVLDKWFSIQAISKLPGVLKTLRQLEKDPAFDPKNPNKMRALYGTFTRNFVQFHDADGSGHQYLADKILEIDAFNPMIAGKFAQAFKKFAKMDKVRQASMKNEMERILKKEDLSKAVFEVLTKTLEDVENREEVQNKEVESKEVESKKVKSRKVKIGKIENKKMAHKKIANVKVKNKKALSAKVKKAKNKKVKSGKAKAAKVQSKKSKRVKSKAKKKVKSKKVGKSKKVKSRK